MSQSFHDIHAILKKNWGFDDFRPLQEDIIRSLLAGKDTLGLMPTGGGKSLTFQVPALCFDSGITIVVTPLISLMKDQVDNLKKHRIKATYLHSAMSAKELRMAWDLIINGNARLLYVSPEKLQNANFMMELRNLKVNFITVDEAHCISQWGYDFRPSYLKIRDLRKLKPGIPVLALTATATPQVCEDIMKQLAFSSSNIFKKSFSRDNISYIVRQSDTKIHDLYHILSRTSGSSIVYVRSRKKTKEIAEYLENFGISSTFYHAGLDHSKKEEHQNLWKDGRVRVIVATNAFGMGIDKPDVRVVIHFDVPPTLEEYYQEAGRAGRDGLPSFAVLLTAKTDKALLNRRVTENFPERKIVKDTYEQICNFLHVSVGEGYEAVKEFDIDRFCNIFSRQEKQCRSSLRLLSQSGYMHFIDEADLRSRMKILCEREELYDVKFENQTTEKVLSATLRLYTGLFTDYVYIRESEVANHLKINNTQVYEALLELDKMKIINYVPRSGLPMIYFPTAREEKTSLIIPISVYEDRKKIFQQRIDAVIDFALSHRDCRVKRMLHYFGENDASDCGKCDVCREKKRTEKDLKKAVENSVENIISYLKAHPDGARLINIQRNCGADRQLTAKNLSYLCNEGFIKFSDDLYFYND